MKLATAAILLVPALAAAEPAAYVPSAYVQGEVMLGGAAPVAGPNLLGGIEAAHRLGSTPLWARAALVYGPAADDQGSGTDRQARLGLEARSCTATGWACGAVAGDLGYLRSTWRTPIDPPRWEQVEGVVVVPRLAVDVGGARIRASLAFELDLAASARHTSSDAAPARETGVGGGELVGGVAYRW